MKSWPVIAAMVVLAACAGLSRDAYATTDEIYTFESGNWLGGAYRDTTTGKFNHCAISGDYQSGIILAISITADYDLQLALGKTSWQLTSGDIYDVALSVDQRFLGTFAAYATDAQSVLVHIGNNADIFDSLRYGQTLVVNAQKETFYFDLMGSNLALQKVKDCVDLATAFSDGQSNPFDGNSTDSFSSASSVPAPDDEFKEALSLVLILAGLDSPTLFEPTAGDAWEGATYAWISGDISGAVYEVAVVGQQAETLVGEILKTLGNECKGRFLSGFKQPRVAGSFTIREAAATCYEDIPTYASLISIIGQADTLIFVHMSASGIGTQLDELNTTLTDIMVSLTELE